jgi:hypothetical protein
LTNNLLFALLIFFLLINLSAEVMKKESICKHQSSIREENKNNSVISWWDYEEKIILKEVAKVIEGKFPP